MSPPWDQRGIKIGKILPRGGSNIFFSRQEGEYFRGDIKISDISLDYPGGDPDSVPKNYTYTQFYLGNRTCKNFK